VTEFQRIMQVCWPLIAGFSLWGGFIWGVYAGEQLFPLPRHFLQLLDK
jgi:hypothetical protein